MQIHAFGGAGCVTFSFTTADAAGSLTLDNLGYAIDHPATPDDYQYAWCKANCKQPRTIPLNASSGIYYFNLTAQEHKSAAFEWAFTLRPSGSAGMLKP